MAQKAEVVTGKAAAAAAMAIAMAMLLGLASAQSGCTTAIIGLAPCLNYITGTTTSTPSSSCCAQLAGVVQSQPACLCSVLNGSASSLGVTINQTRALTLPEACSVQTPPVSECNASARSPTGSPAAPPTPADLAPESPSSPSSRVAEGGSKATQQSTSDAPSFKSTGPLMLSLIVLFLGVCVPFSNIH